MNCERGGGGLWQKMKLIRSTGVRLRKALYSFSGVWTVALGNCIVDRK